MDELRIAWVSTSNDRVGMTVLPGRTWASTAPPVPARDLDVDLARVSHDAETLVLLVTDEELAANGASEIVERGLRQGLSVVRRPVIADRAVPPWLMDEIADWGGNGPVVYACTSGHGRSAQAVAWALVAAGASADAAVSQVRVARGPKALASISARASVTTFATFRATIDDPGRLTTIATGDLRRAHLPPPRAPWRLLSPFALLFDGYAHAGGTDGLSAYLSPRLRSFQRDGLLDASLTVDDARACIFGIQRSWHWRLSDAGPDYDPGPSADELLFIWALVEHIRARSPRA
jgi:hypothetical protein